MRHCLPKTVLLSYIGHKFRIPRSTLSSLTQCCNTHFSALFIIFDKLQDFHRSHTSYDSTTANECELYCPPPPFLPVSSSIIVCLVFTAEIKKEQNKNLYDRIHSLRGCCVTDTIYLWCVLYSPRQQLSLLFPPREFLWRIAHTNQQCPAVLGPPLHRHIPETTRHHIVKSVINRRSQGERERDKANRARQLNGHELGIKRKGETGN